MKETPPQWGGDFLSLHISVQLLQKLPQGLEQYQYDDEIADAVGDVEGNTAGPFGHGEADAADEGIRDAAQGTEE
jgi:hypothetical protein